MSSRYQGYPYVNPIVTDAPTLDPATAAKWTNLPRRGVISSLAGPSGSGAGSTGFQDNPTASSSSMVPIPPKKDIDDNPVVYIELPEPDGSDVCQSIEAEDVEPEYVQDTILYDPFEDRRIIPKEEACSESSGSDTQSMGSPQMHSRPARPNELDIMSPGPSNIQSPMTGSTPGLSSFMEKESLVYGSQNSYGFPLSTIPMSEFPDPPPAYTELAPIQSAQSPVSQPPTSQQMAAPMPPRTEVIVPTPNPVSPIGVMNYERKYLTCHHCGAKVHTLVIRENGYMTHLIACLLFLFVMPFFLLVYFTDYFKHKNHYCPNCNQLIGYELPLFGKKVNYVV